VIARSGVAGLCAARGRP